MQVAVACLLKYTCRIRAWQVAVKQANKLAIVSMQLQCEVDCNNEKGTNAASAGLSSVTRVQKQSKSWIAAYPSLPMPLLDQESGKPPWLSADSIDLKRGMSVMTKMPYAVYTAPCRHDSCNATVRACHRLTA